LGAAPSSVDHPPIVVGVRAQTRVVDLAGGAVLAGGTLRPREFSSRSGESSPMTTYESRFPTHTQAAQSANIRTALRRGELLYAFEV